MQAHIPLMMEACVGGCNRDLKEMLQDMNSVRIHDRMFFSQGPPSVAIHSGVGGRAGGVGGGGSGRGGGDGGGGGGVRNVHNGNQAVGGRQALGIISSGSSRVNGENFGEERGREDLSEHVFCRFALLDPPHPLLFTSIWFARFVCHVY